MESEQDFGLPIEEEEEDEVNAASASQTAPTASHTKRQIIYRDAEIELDGVVLSIAGISQNVVHNLALRGVAQLASRYKSQAELTALAADLRLDIPGFMAVRRNAPKINYDDLWRHAWAEARAIKQLKTDGIKAPRGQKMTDCEEYSAQFASELQYISAQTRARLNGMKNHPDISAIYVRIGGVLDEI